MYPAANAGDYMKEIEINRNVCLKSDNTQKYSSKTTISSSKTTINTQKCIHSFLVQVRFDRDKKN